MGEKPNEQDDERKQATEQQERESATGQASGRESPTRASQGRGAAVADVDAEGLADERKSGSVVLADRGAEGKTTAMDDWHQQSREASSGGGGGGETRHAGPATESPGPARPSGPGPAQPGGPGPATPGGGP